jgi:TRAP-type uncharacterized transport system substrate-binding protein
VSKVCAAAALDLAEALTLSDDRRFCQVALEIAGAGAGGGPLALFASDNPEGIDAVVAGQAAMALVNPAVMLTLAYRGTGPFTKPLPVRAIAIMPSYDQFAFAVTADTGLTSLEDVRERHFPLRIAVRGQRNHSVHPILKCVLAAAGISEEELRSWGGGAVYERDIESPTQSVFDSPARLEMAQNGTINAIFDEAVNRWLKEALEIGMRVIPVGEGTMRNLEPLGFRRTIVDRASYPLLDADVEAVDFSGFAIFVRADAPDDLVTSICAGLDLRRARVPWEGSGPLPLSDMCRDTPDGPLDVPVHPAAERYWLDLGYRPGERSGLTGELHPRRIPLERPPRIRSMLTLEIAAEVLARADAADDPGAFSTRIQLRQQSQARAEWFATIVAGEPERNLADLRLGRADVAVIPRATEWSKTTALRVIGETNGCVFVTKEGDVGRIIESLTVSKFGVDAVTGR